jgi:hypothetical protein
LEKAKKCAKEINKNLKELIKDKMFNLDNKKNFLKPTVTVMPKYYEKNGINYHHILSQIL